MRPTSPRPRGLARSGAVVATTIAVLLVGSLTACSDKLPEGVDPQQVDAVAAPDLGACRNLTLDDVVLASNASVVVDCATPHTAQTVAVGSLPARLHEAAYGASELGAFAFKKCSRAFMSVLGADESQAMRTVLTWAWFRPSEDAWADGARWYRCDVVGGGEQSEHLWDLPERLNGLLAKPNDEWLVCASGPTVDRSTKVPCATPHDWRAVSTIKVGEPEDPYPGDRAVEATTRSYCSESVGAWLGYPDDYDYGYTWFHEAEWTAGNRRSVCWAKTSQ